jgi:FAD binding domain
VIDLSRLADVEIIDKERHLVRIGGGATWGQVAAALAPHGLAISSGDTKSVGVGGLTLTGGIGWKVRKYGLALDNVVAAEVITAGGEVVNASAAQHPELFWAIRGGGGNFGIVTAFDFAAHPTTDVFYGTITFPASEAAAVIQGWADHLRTAPDELTSTADLANPFRGPEAPVEIHVAFDGDDPELAAQAIDPIRRLGPVLADDVVPRPYADTLAEGPPPPPGLKFAIRSAFAGQQSAPAVLQILAEAKASEASPFIAVRSVGGAVSRVPGDATAYAHRQAELMFVTTSAGTTPPTCSPATTTSGPRSARSPETDPDLQVNCHGERAGQGADAGGERLRRDVTGAGPHGHQRREIGVVQAQLVAHAGDVGPSVATVGLGEPLGLAPVDADHAERPLEFA